MAIKKGRYLTVKIGEDVLVGMTSKSLSEDMDFEEVTTDDSSGNAKEHMPTFHDATVDFEGLHDPDTDDREHLKDLFDKLEDGTEFEWTIAEGVDTGDYKKTAQGFMASISWEGETQSAQSFSGTIQRTGQFTNGTVE
ncbi:MAG: phage tail tube protein [Bacteroidota bacterium]